MMPVRGLGDSVTIGERVARPGLTRLLRGRGRYVGDIVLPRMLHLAFLRSPHAHAKILKIDGRAAQEAAGVRAVMTGADLKDHCLPLLGAAANRVGHKAPPQYPMAVDRVHWQGQPVVAIVAETRAMAEDALDLVEVEWDVLEPVVDPSVALEEGQASIHPELDDNLAYEHVINTGDPDRAFAGADCVIEGEFRFHRQAALTLEPRGIVADYDPGADRLTVYHSHQSPFQMQDVFAQHMRLPESSVRVVAPDVGGGFGMKINTYAEELAVAVISRIVKRPIKFCADRLESFSSDMHSRDHEVSAKIALTSDGRIEAMAVDDLSAIGAFGVHMRFNIAESMMLITNLGAPYSFQSYRARGRNVYVNKNIIGMFRGVGIPLSCAITEVLLDLAADRIGVDPVALRKMNYRKPESMPCVTPGGSKLANMRLEACLDRLVERMDYKALRAEQQRLRSQGIFRGIGIATYIEPVAYGPLYYGPTGASITSQDGCTLRLEPSGALRCVTSITDQGQGTLAALAQIISDEMRIPVGSIDMISGDSTISTYGGGAWASRGVMCGGEAAIKASRALKENILKLAAAVSQAQVDDLDLAASGVINKRTGLAVMSLSDVARIGYFRQDTLPSDLDVQLSVTKSHVVNNLTYYTTSGVQASYLEVDPRTGCIRLLGHWTVADSGRAINPLLVEEQLRGGIVQGIGSALYEECIYDEAGNLMNATMADYLAPMASEMPDIDVDLLDTRESTTELGAKGIGESGLIGAIGALWVAVTDALKPFGARVVHQPFTPERILDAIAAASSQGK